jgi:hypothetical protein
MKLLLSIIKKKGLKISEAANPRRTDNTLTKRRRTDNTLTKRITTKTTNNGVQNTTQKTKD